MKKLGIIIFTIAAMTLIGCKNSRIGSRFGGGALELQLPADFARAISMDFEEDEKNLFYESTSGELKVKTYTDYGFLESEIIFVPAMAN